MHDRRWDNDPGRWLVGWAVMLLFVVLMVAALVWIAVSLSSRQGRAPTTPLSPAAPQQAAEEILAQRLARGEMDIDDYRARLEALRRPQP